MLMTVDDQKTVAAQRMKRVLDRNFDGQNPGIVNSLPTPGPPRSCSLFLVETCKR
jgi:hypothetical protein